MHTLKAILGGLIAACLITAPARADPPVDPTAGDAVALDAAIHAACDKRVVVLGETGSHSDGHAIAFKAALAQRLIAQCGFKAVLWESSFYEFDHLDRLTTAGTPVTRDQVAAAIGGIWNKDVPLQPLIDDLTARANRHDLTLGGFDDIWGMAGMPYTTDDLPKALAARLDPADAAACTDAFHRYIYSLDDPYTPADQHHLLDCLNHIRNAQPALDRRDLDILDSLQRDIANAFVAKAFERAASERSGWLNLRTLIDRLPADSKVIVWTATVHGAREATSDGTTIKSMGGYIHDAFGGRSFILAVGAAGGSFGLAGRDTVLPIPTPATGSVEAQAMAGSDTAAVYVSPAKLKSFGIAPAGLFFHTPTATRDWSQTVDAAVILRDEYPMPHIPAPAK